MFFCSARFFSCIEAESPAGPPYIYFVMNKFGSLSDYGIHQQLQHHISFSHNSQATFLSIEKLMLNRGIWGENYSDNSSSTSQ